MSNSRSPARRFRHHRGRAVAGVIVAISTFSLASLSPWLLLLMVPPLVWTVWVWRAGTDADQDGLRVRALVGHRRISWSEVSALRPDRRRWLVATLTDGGEVPLTAVAASDADALVRASGTSLAGAES